VYNLDDTIAAVASAAGGAARGILRISGPCVVDVLAALFRPSDIESLAQVRSPRRLSGMLSLAGPSFAASGGRVLEVPADLYLWPGTRSYTRQPSGELHTFGSSPLLAAALRALCACGARLAEPGEFTLRAFLAGRIDLTQAEAVLGVIDAVGRRDLDIALAQLAGGLAAPLQALRERLLNLLAHLEAGLDFVEEDIEFIARDELAEQLAAAIEKVAALTGRMGERASAVDVPRIVLVGSPNVGKSSLFNLLTGTPDALVANLPGTTRDFVRAVIDLDGSRCELIDTAGVESASGFGEESSTSQAGADPLRAAAQRFTAAERQRADLCLLCLDASRPLNAWEREELDGLVADAATVADNPAPQRVIVVHTKTDAAISRPDVPMPAIRTSARTGAGLEELRSELCRRLPSLARPDGGIVLPTAERAGASLRAAVLALQRALAVHRDAGGEELIAAELRGALDELGKVVGAVYTDDILDRVFSRFCIGK
jgi:tRNA modification GTPase